MELFIVLIFAFPLYLPSGPLIFLSRPVVLGVKLVPRYRAEMYCASCEVRTEFIYVM
jgi:hypothetical protein